MRNTLIFILLSVFHSCTYDSGTKYTLKLSGKNKKELLKVIEHYKNEPNKKAATNYQPYQTSGTLPECRLQWNIMLWI